MEAENFIPFSTFFHEAYWIENFLKFKKSLILNLENEKISVEEIQKYSSLLIKNYYPISFKVSYQNEMLLIKKLSVCITSKDGQGLIIYSIFEPENNDFSKKEIFGSPDFIPIKKFNLEFPNIVKELKNHTAPEI